MLVRLRMFLLVACLVVKVGVATQAAGLFAGVAEVEITPYPDVPLSGPVGGNGLATTVHDPLMARALAVRSGNQRVVFCVVDITMIATDLHQRIRASVSQATGIEEKGILISATHTHRSPRAIRLDLGEAHEQFKERLVDRVAQVITDALGESEPVKIGWTSIEKPEYCRNRRWLLKPGSVPVNPFGKRDDQVGMKGNGPGANGVRPVGPIDPELFIVSVKRTDDSQLALLANYSIHYGNGGSGVSADYFGHFSRALVGILGATERRPIIAMMSNGTSGNISSSGGDPKVVGKTLAESVASAIEGINHCETLEIGTGMSTVMAGVRKPSPERLVWARAMLRADEKTWPHHWTPRFARSALWLDEYPDKLAVNLYAIRMDELLILGMPNEVFAETGLAIKAGSPSSATFTISLANGYAGYLPPPEQHRLGGYTTWPAVSSCLDQEAEPLIREAALALLRRVYP